MFEKYEVWSRGDEYVLRHLVFRDIESALYHLQQTDYLYVDGPDAVAKASAQQLGLAVELFLEEPPSYRAKGFRSIAEAIAGRHEEPEF